MKNKNSFEYRTGKYGEGSKGPFQNDIMARMGIQVYRLARRSPMTLEELRVDLNEYFDEYFGKGTLSRTPSDGLRRRFLVDRMILAIEQIRAGQKPTPLWN
jgi:hypothetical protein